MDLEQRLEVIGKRLDDFIRISLDWDQEYHERMVAAEGQIAEVRSTLREAVEHSRQNEKRIERLVDLVESLATIAKSHERRLDDLEGRSPA